MEVTCDTIEAATHSGFDGESSRSALGARLEGRASRGPLGWIA